MHDLAINADAYRAILTKKIWAITELTPDAKLLLIYLASKCNYKRFVSGETHTTIANALGMSDSNLNNAIEEASVLHFLDLVHECSCGCLVFQIDLEV